MPVSRHAQAVSTLIRLGWKPPPLSTEQSLWLLEDMEEKSRWNRTLDLSPAELRVMQLLANGETAISAAEKLGVSRETTKATAKNVRAKMGVKTITHAVALLVDESVIEVKQLPA